MFKRKNDGVAVSALAGKDSIILQGLPWDVRMAQEGKLYGAHAGSETAAITFANLVADQDQPEFLLRVPQGTSVVPIYVGIYRQASGAVLSETVFTASSNDVGNGTSSAIEIGPVNMKSGDPQTSACTARQLVTSNVSALTSPLEFYRAGTPTDMDAAAGETNPEEWSYKIQSAPMLKGPASFLISAVCGTSSVGFIVVTWAEFLTSELE